MKTRVLSAIVLLAIFIPLLLMGGLAYSTLMLLIALFALHEILNIRKTKKEFPFFVELCAYILMAFITFNNYTSKNLSFLMDYRLMSVIMCVFLSPMVFINDSKKYNLNDALFLVASTLFVGLSFNLLILLRNFSLDYVIYLFIIATITDTFAYITGRYIGKNKLAPLISPKKTIEGMLGGTLIGVVAGTLYYTTVINPVTKAIFAAGLLLKKMTTLLLSISSIFGLSVNESKSFQRLSPPSLTTLKSVLCSPFLNP